MNLKPTIFFIKMNIIKLFKALFPATAIALFFFSCSSADGESDNETAEERVEPVRVIEIDYSEISRSITHIATLQPFMDIHLAPASPGRIERINVEASDRVSKGDLLVEMDKTQLNQALVQLQNLEKDYRRLETLKKEGSIPEQQYDQIKTQYEVALSNVEFLKENTTLEAPFSGTVSGRYFENGEMFTGTPNTPEGKAAILSLVETGRLKVSVNVSERFYPSIKTGMPVSIKSDIYPGEEFSGSVLRIYPVIDNLTRTFRIELVVPNPGERLRPGMFARATLDVESAETLVVPAIAVLKVQGSNDRYVFIEEDGRAKRVVVEIGDRYDDMVEIISDEIAPGDNLVIAGQGRLVDGVAVQVEK